MSGAPGPHFLGDSPKAQGVVRVWAVVALIAWSFATPSRARPEPAPDTRAALEKVIAICRRMEARGLDARAIDSVATVVAGTHVSSDDDFARVSLMQMLWADLLAASGKVYSADSIYAALSSDITVDPGPYPKRWTETQRLVRCLACGRRVDRLMAKGRFTVAFRVEEDCGRYGGCPRASHSMHETVFRASLACEKGDPDLAFQLLAGAQHAAGGTTSLADSVAADADLGMALLAIHRRCAGEGPLTRLIQTTLVKSSAIERAAWEDSVLEDADTPAELSAAIEDRRRVAEDLAELKQEQCGNEAVEEGFNRLTLQVGGQMAAIESHFGDLQFMKEGGRDFSLIPRIASLHRQLAILDQKIARLLERMRR